MVVMWLQSFSPHAVLLHKLVGIPAAVQPVKQYVVLIHAVISPFRAKANEGAY